MNGTAVSFPDTARPPLPMELLASYEIIECLSHSNQAETFIVRSRKSGACLLAKLCQKPAAAGTGELAMLQRLDHPAIPKITDGFETADSVCVIREYIEGSSLNELDVPLDESYARDAVSASAHHNTPSFSTPS